MKGESQGSQLRKAKEKVWKAEERNINPNHRVSGTTQFYMIFVEELSLLTRCLKHK